MIFSLKYFKATLIPLVDVWLWFDLEPLGLEKWRLVEGVKNEALCNKLYTDMRATKDKSL